MSFDDVRAKAIYARGSARKVDTELTQFLDLLDEWEAEVRAQMTALVRPAVGIATEPEAAPPTGSIDGPEIQEITFGDTRQFTASTFSNGTLVLVWESANEAIFTVDANGLGTHVAEGEADLILTGTDEYGQFQDTVLVRTLAQEFALTAGTISVGPTDGANNVSWTPATGGTNPKTYQLHASTTSGFTPGAGNAVAGATEPSTQYPVPGTNGVPHYFQVVATDSATPTPATVTYAEASGTPSTSHEPTGFTVIMNHDGSSKVWPGFSAPGAAKWSADNTYVEVVADATNPTGSGFAIEYRFPAGAIMRSYRHIYQNFGYHLIDPSFGPLSERYMRIRMQASSNFLNDDQTTDSMGMKLFGYLGHVGDNSAYYISNGGTAFPWRLQAAAQPGNDGKFFGGVPENNAFLAYPNWNTIEIYQKALSAIGAADGIFRMWVNGVLVTDVTNVDVPNDVGDPLNFDRMEFGSMRGSHTNEVPLTETDWVRYGEVYMSGVLAA